MTLQPCGAFAVLATGNLGDEAKKARGGRRRGHGRLGLALGASADGPWRGAHNVCSRKG